MNKALSLLLEEGRKEWFRGEKEKLLMKVCPECRTKNDDVNHFCKKCGFLITGTSFSARRKEVSGGQKKSPWVFIFLFLLALGLGAIAFWIIQGRTTAHPKIAVQTKEGHVKIFGGIRH